MKWILLLLLTSCAANQSAFPVAPPFNPATDAPITIGHPGYVAPEPPPRSPHKRVLPQTPETRREDGLWATSAPPLRQHTFLIYDEVIPFSFPSDLDAVPAYDCAERAQAVANSVEHLRDAIYGLPHVERACIAVMSLDACLGHRAEAWIWAHGEAESSTASVMLEGHSIKAARDVTAMLLEKLCKDGRTTRVDLLMIQWFAQELRNTQKGQPH